MKQSCERWTQHHRCYATVRMCESADYYYLVPRCDSLTKQSFSLLACLLPHIFQRYIFVCTCSLLYDTLRVRRMTGIWPNIDKGMIHENVIIRNVPKTCCVNTVSEFTCLLFTSSVLFPICPRYVGWQWSSAIWQDLDYAEGGLSVPPPS